MHQPPPSKTKYEEGLHPLLTLLKNESPFSLILGKEPENAVYSLFILQDEELVL
jgi:hypothetical protein